MQFLGVKIEVATAERVVLTMEVTPKVHQYVGIMNGGVSLYLCETAASIGVVAGCDLTSCNSRRDRDQREPPSLGEQGDDHCRGQTALPGPNVERLEH